jgi:hypothetical protein
MGVKERVCQITVSKLGASKGRSSPRAARTSIGRLDLGAASFALVSLNEFGSVAMIWAASAP